MAARERMKTRVRGHLEKKFEKVVKSHFGKIPGSAQTAEVCAILEGLLYCKKYHVREVTVVTDSDYCFKAGTQELRLLEGQRLSVC